MQMCVNEAQQLPQKILTSICNVHDLISPALSDSTVCHLDRGLDIYAACKEEMPESLLPPALRKWVSPERHACLKYILA